MKSMCKIMIVAMALLPVLVNAENFAENGSFEETGPCSNFELLKKRGFILKFEKPDWTQLWIINHATGKAEVALASEGVAEGKKYLQVKNQKGNTHVYLNKKYPGGMIYNISLKSKIFIWKGGCKYYCLFLQGWDGCWW